MPRIMGSGCAIFDADGDGRLDLYLLHHGGSTGKKNQLYLQLADGTFRDASAGSGLDRADFWHGVAIGDMDNDGRPDVLLTRLGGLCLLRNQGNGKFTDVTASSGLFNPLWATSAAFVDYDRDGWLDLLVVNYLDYDPRRECLSPQGQRDFCAPSAFSPVASKLFRNLGANKQLGQFEDVSFASGIGRLPGPGLGVVCADFDGDGWPDFFIANDGKPNHLWINQRDGTFRNQAVSRGVATSGTGTAMAGMGVALGDVSGNGLFDLYVTHLGSETNTLWQQGPRGQFRDQSTAAGLTDTHWRGTGFGTLMADFDCDGWLDIALVNGRVALGGNARASGQGFWEPYAERNQLLAGVGNGRFLDVSLDSPALCGFWNIGRGLACGDVDGDGAPDLLVNSIAGKARLLRNVAPRKGHWLLLRVVDPAYNRDAYGAELRVRAADREWLRQVQTAESYLSSSSPLVHVGLGSSNHFDAIVVTWPDGQRELFPGGPADRQLELRRGQGRQL